MSKQCEFCPDDATRQLTTGTGTIAVCTDCAKNHTVYFGEDPPGKRHTGSLDDLLNTLDAYFMRDRCEASTQMVLDVIAEIKSLSVQPVEGGTKVVPTDTHPQLQLVRPSPLH